MIDLTYNEAMTSLVRQPHVNVFHRELGERVKLDETASNLILCSDSRLMPRGEVFASLGWKLTDKAAAYLKANGNVVITRIEAVMFKEQIAELQRFFREDFARNVLFADAFDVFREVIVSKVEFTRRKKDEATASFKIAMKLGRSLNQINEALEDDVVTTGRMTPVEDEDGNEADQPIRRHCIGCLKPVMADLCYECRLLVEPILKKQCEEAAKIHGFDDGVTWSFFNIGDYEDDSCDIQCDDGAIFQNKQVRETGMGFMVEPSEIVNDDTACAYVTKLIMSIKISAASSSAAPAFGDVASESTITKADDPPEVAFSADALLRRRDRETSEELLRMRAALKLAQDRLSAVLKVIDLAGNSVSLSTMQEPEALAASVKELLSQHRGSDLDKIEALCIELGRFGIPEDAFNGDADAIAAAERRRANLVENCRDPAMMSLRTSTFAAVKDLILTMDDIVGRR